MSERPTPDPAAIRRRPAVAAGLLLAVLAIAGGWGAVDPTRSHAAPGGPVPRRSTRAPVPPPRTDVPAPAPVEEPERAAPGRGPEEPLREDPSDRVDPGTLRVERIVYDAGDPDATFAIVGGRAVRAGDRLSGWPVFRILPGAVRLGEEGEVTVRVSKEGVR